MWGKDTLEPSPRIRVANSTGGDSITWKPDI